MPHFSLIHVVETYDSGEVSGIRIQNHIGTLETASELAEVYASSSHASAVAVIPEIPSPTAWDSGRVLPLALFPPKAPGMPPKQLIDVCREIIAGGSLRMVADAPEGGVFSRRYNKIDAAELELSEQSSYEAEQLAKYRKERGEPSWMVLDAFTASSFVQIYDLLNEENQKLLCSYPITRQVNVMWKLVQRCAK